MVRLKSHLDWFLTGRPEATRHRLRFLLVCCFVGLVAALASLPGSRGTPDTAALLLFLLAMVGIPVALRAGLPEGWAKGLGFAALSFFLFFMSLLPEEQEYEQVFWFSSLVLAGGLLMGTKGILLAGAVSLASTLSVFVYFHGWAGLDGPVLDTLVDASIFLLSCMTLTAVYERFYASALSEAEHTLEAEARSRKALSRSERFLRAVLDQEPECVKLVDADARVLDMNPAGLRMVAAQSIRDIRGIDVRELLRPAYRHAYFESLQAVLQGEKRMDVFELVALDGTHRWMEQHSAPLYDEHDEGTVKAVLSVSRDITERKRGESDRLRTQRMEAIGNLAGGIAHDLNNLLTPLRLGIDELREAASDDENEVLDTMSGSLDHAKSMLQQLLDFARGTEVTRATVDVAKIIRDVEVIIESTFPRSIALHIDVDPSTPSFIADATQVRQTLINLCLNSRDAMEKGGKITITAQSRFVDAPQGVGAEAAPPGEYIALSVRDQGFGIPPEHVKSIFEPFYTTKDPHEGTGLGLSTVLGIVRGHGGFVDVESTEGVGTCITAYLPLAHGPKMPAPISSEAVRIHGQERTILLVDDEEIVTRLTTRMLMRAGFLVHVAGDGLDAAAILRTESRPDLVLTDLHMPRMDGLTLIEQVRSEHPSLPVVLMSGRIDDSARRRLEAFPELVVLHKPFGRNELQNALLMAFSQRIQRPKAAS